MPTPICLQQGAADSVSCANYGQVFASAAEATAARLHIWRCKQISMTSTQNFAAAAGYWAVLSCDMTQSGQHMLIRTHQSTLHTIVVMAIQGILSLAVEFTKQRLDLLQTPQRVTK